MIATARGLRSSARESPQKAKQEEEGPGYEVRKRIQSRKETNEKERGKRAKGRTKGKLVRQPYVTATLRRYPRRILSSAYSRERNPGGRQTRTK